MSDLAPVQNALKNLQLQSLDPQKAVESLQIQSIRPFTEHPDIEPSSSVVAHFLQNTSQAITIQLTDVHICLTTQSRLYRIYESVLPKLGEELLGEEQSDLDPKDKPNHKELLFHAKIIDGMYKGMDVLGCFPVGKEEYTLQYYSIAKVSGMIRNTRAYTDNALMNFTPRQERTETLVINPFILFLINSMDIIDRTEHLSYLPRRIHEHIYTLIGPNYHQSKPTEKRNRDVYIKDVPLFLRCNPAGEFQDEVSKKYVSVQFHGTILEGEFKDLNVVVNLDIKAKPERYPFGNGTLSASQIVLVSGQVTTLFIEDIVDTNRRYVYPFSNESKRIQHLATEEFSDKNPPLPAVIVVFAESIRRKVVFKESLYHQRVTFQKNGNISSFYSVGPEEVDFELTRNRW